MYKHARHIMLWAMLLFAVLNTSAQVAMPDTVCVGTTRTYRVNDPSVPSTYTWQIDGITQASTTNSITVTWNVPGTFQITVVEHSANGCDGDIRSGQVIVQQMSSIPPVRYPTITTQAFAATQLTARNLGPDPTYSWSPSTGLNSSVIMNPIFNYDKTTEYLVIITTNNGCSIIDTQLVRIQALPAPVTEDLFVPTAWSPNGDGHNDVLRPLLANIREIRYFRIFNRWGELVFETTVIGRGWDGIYNGRPQFMDTYTWTAEGVGISGRVIKKTGNSILLR